MSDEARVVAALRLAELRAGFGEKLVARLDELAAALTRARAGDGIARAEARMLAHRLAGTAGSYGYAGAGRHATVIEQALDGDDAVGDAAWSGIFAALDAARISSGP
ncbi:MAG: Hpt domain-containing protein [Myxococcales bacterium]|nr:Hpt domain-containing protein [Myxococcales bacterium]